MSLPIKHVSGGSFGFSTEPEMELRRAFYRNNDVRVTVKPHKSISTRLTISLGLLAMQAQAKRIAHDRMEAREWLACHI